MYKFNIKINTNTANRIQDYKSRNDDVTLLRANLKKIQNVKILDNQIACFIESTLKLNQTRLLYINTTSD